VGGAQELTGVRPDLTTFGKVIGGGLNVGAYGGRAEVMSVVAPLGPVYQAGTLSGNPLATAAGLAALEHLEPSAYVALEATATRLADGLHSALHDAGVVATVPRYSTLVGISLTAEQPHDYREAKATDTERFGRFFHAMLRRGVAIAPGAYEVLFPALAHADEIVDEVVEAARAAAAEVS
jgi:glutamate-1-semialdehyde 2,1-aminomutase